MLLLPLALGAAEAPSVVVEVSGVEGQLKDNVLGYLGIHQYAGRRNLTENTIRRLHARARGEIRQALKPLGYYEPVIEAKLERKNGDGAAGHWHARYRIEPGPPVRFKRVAISVTGPGEEFEAFSRLLDRVPLEEGAVARHDHYESAKTELRETAARFGYFEARLTESTLRIDPEERTAEAIIHFETGPRYRFGEVMFEQDILEDEFLRRYLPFGPGDPYVRDEVLTLQYSLADSQYFESVNVEARPRASEDRRVPVRVQLRPRRKHRYTLGVGYGTDTGPRGVIGWENRRVNRHGHRLAAEIRPSQIKTTGAIRYLVPLDEPATEHMAVSLSRLHEEIEDGVSRETKLELSRTDRLDDWRQTLLVRFTRHDDTLGDRDFRSDMIVPGGVWSITHSDDPVVPANGYRFLTELNVADESFGSDASFAQVRLDSRLIHSLVPGTRVLLRGEAGTTTVDEFNDLPLSYRFFTGGDRSVRGFDYKELGPRDTDGNNIGGQHLLVGSVEVEKDIVGKWSVAAFTDMGNAFNSRDTKLEQSVGLGLRWRSPVGMIRIDVARALERPDKGYRLHLSIGPDL